MRREVGLLHTGTERNFTRERRDVNVDGTWKCDRRGTDTQVKTERTAYNSRNSCPHLTMGVTTDSSVCPLDHGNVQNTGVPSSRHPLWCERFRTSRSRRGPFSRSHRSRTSSTSFGNRFEGRWCATRTRRTWGDRRGLSGPLVYRVVGRDCRSETDG